MYNYDTDSYDNLKKKVTGLITTSFLFVWKGRVYMSAWKNCGKNIYLREWEWMVENS